MMVASYAPAPAAKKKVATSSSIVNPTPQRRVICGRCARPAATCVCDALPPAPIALTTRVLVLQHPREAKKAIGSVHLLPLCLEHVEIVEAAVPWTRGSEPLHAPSQLEWLQRSIREGYEPLLLFPSKDAIALDEPPPPRPPPPQQQPKTKNKKVLLVMIDGTWSQARHLLRHSPAMAAACTHVKFEAEREAIIGALRREPERHCTSTLEACARMLRVVEPTAQTEAAAAHMEAALSAMVEAQNQFIRVQ